jgi:nickel-type superoxide dismutase maturation protease
MLLLAKFKISGHSMTPGIKNGETVLVSGIFYLFKNPQIGDIVAFREAEKILIKRITEVKDKEYFLEGDNNRDSLDSKNFGFILRENIIGKVIYKL